jgi:hypothetical protein
MHSAAGITETARPASNPYLVNAMMSTATPAASIAPTMSRGTLTGVVMLP